MRYAFASLIIILFATFPAGAQSTCDMTCPSISSGSGEVKIDDPNNFTCKSTGSIRNNTNSAIELTAYQAYLQGYACVGDRPYASSTNGTIVPTQGTEFKLERIDTPETLQCQDGLKMLDYGGGTTVPVKQGKVVTTVDGERQVLTSLKCDENSEEPQEADEIVSLCKMPTDMCKYMNSFHSCWFCEPFNSMTTIISKLAKQSFELFRGTCVTLIAVCFVGWFTAHILLRISLVDGLSDNPWKMTENVGMVLFKAIVASAILLSGGGVIYEYFVVPVIQVAMSISFALNRIEVGFQSTGDAFADMNATIQTFLKCAAYMIMDVFAMGWLLMKHGLALGWYCFFPSPEPFFTGIVFIIASIFLLIQFPAKLFDALIRLTFVCMMMPFIVTAWVFPNDKLKEYVKKAYTWIISVATTFMFASLSVYIGRKFLETFTKLKFDNHTELLEKLSPSRGMIEAAKQADKLAKHVKSCSPNLAKWNSEAQNATSEWKEYYISLMQECLDSKAQLAAAQQAKEGLHYETFEPGMAFFVILAVLVILIIVLAKIGLLGTLTMAAGKIAKTTVKAAYEMSPNNDTRNNMTEAFTGVKAKTTGEVNKEVNKMGGKLVIKTATVAGKLIDGNDK